MKKRLMIKKQSVKAERAMEATVTVTMMPMYQRYVVLIIFRTFISTTSNKLECLKNN